MLTPLKRYQKPYKKEQFKSDEEESKCLGLKALCWVDPGQQPNMC